MVDAGVDITGARVADSSVQSDDPNTPNGYDTFTIIGIECENHALGRTCIMIRSVLLTTTAALTFAASTVQVPVMRVTDD